MSNEVYEIPQFQRNHLPVKLLYVTKSKYNKYWHSTNHAHHFTELLYITKGKGTFIFYKEEIPVKEHDLIIINPNVGHTEKSDTNHSNILRLVFKVSPFHLQKIRVRSLFTIINRRKIPVSFTFSNCLKKRKISRKIMS